MTTILDWLEKHIYLVLLWPRSKDLDLLNETRINKFNVKKLAQAADISWAGIKEKNLKLFAQGLLDSFNAQTTMFPSMIKNRVNEVIEKYKTQAIAWKLAGAGGGGYLLLVSDQPIKDAMRIKIRRKGLGL